jgi:hypothetical protein
MGALMLCALRFAAAFVLLFAVSFALEDLYSAMGFVNLLGEEFGFSILGGALGPFDHTSQPASHVREPLGSEEQEEDDQ